jgi:hypothetical protein
MLKTGREIKAPMLRALNYAKLGPGLSHHKDLRIEAQYFREL